MYKITLFRLQLLLLCVIMIVTASGCSLGSNSANENIHDTDSEAPVQESTPDPVPQPKADKGQYQTLVINDILLEDYEYIIENINGSAYILVSEDIITYAFKIPDSQDYYPELNKENGQISMSWFDHGKLILKIDMVEGSDEAYMDESDEPIKIGAAPRTINGKLFIPINLYAEKLKMKETFDKDLGVTFLHYEKDFPKTDLVGNWSDSDTNLFALFDKAVNGEAAIPSLATGYQFLEDGTYQLLMIGVGDSDEKLIRLSGQYRILGNTIVYFNVKETVYEGNPLALVQEDQPLDRPIYEFIDQYDEKEKAININGFWMSKLEP